MLSMIFVLIHKEVVVVEIFNRISKNFDVLVMLPENDINLTTVHPLQAMDVVYDFVPIH